MIQKETYRSAGLARALSKLGFCSRSVARELIVSGNVAVNGRKICDPEARVRLGADRLEVNRERVAEARKIYLMLNKPRGVVTTARDEKGRETVYSLVPEYRQWVAPVGRLDKASEGLLLLTNDSAWAAKITTPASHIEKTYHLQTWPIPGKELLKELTSGVKTDDGDCLTAKRATMLRQGGKNCWLEIVLTEGKNRHIRRMLAARGFEVLRLIRISIGPLRLGDLKKGSVRELTAQEKQSLAI